VTDFGFTGQRREAGFGLYDYRARYYSPGLGRFVSPDSLVPQPGNPQDLNRYAYVRNSPLVYTDPSGNRLARDPLGEFTTAPYRNDWVLVEVPAPVLTYEERRWANFELTGNPGFIPGVPQTGYTLASLNYWGFTDYSLGDGWQGQVLERFAADPDMLLMFSAALIAAVQGEGLPPAPQIRGLPRSQYGDAIGEPGPTGTNPGPKFPPIKSGAANGPTAGQRFPESVRRQAEAENPQRICVYCRMIETATDVDHAIPRSRGGNATIENAQLTCPHCNRSKGARDFPVTPPEGYQGPWPPPWW